MFISPKSRVPRLNGATGRVVNGARRAALAVLLVTAALAPSFAAPAAETGEPIRLLALGDSLVAGYGLAMENAFPQQLERALAERGYTVEVINAGVSGDTTAGGLARLDWVLADDPDMVLVSLGANDGLRGIDPAVSRRNLAAILETLQARGLPTLLAGMYAPPNLGREYGEAFNSMYPELAGRYDVPLFPFFLEDVATRPAFNQPDGIHPNAAGVEIIVDNIAPYIVDLIESAGLAEPSQG